MSLDIRRPSLDTIRDLGKCVADTVSSINYGGCCVYAATLGERLIALGVPTWGRVGEYRGRDTKTVSIPELRENAKRNNNSFSTVLDWNRAGLFFNHVFLQFVLDGTLYSHDTRHILTGPIKTFIAYDVKEGEFSIEELRQLADCEDGWNDTFDRRSIPKIHKIVDKYLPIH